MSQSLSVAILILELKGRKVQGSSAAQLAAAGWRELRSGARLRSHLPWATLNAATFLASCASKAITMSPHSSMGRVRVSVNFPGLFCF